MRRLFIYTGLMIFLAPPALASEHMTYDIYTGGFKSITTDLTLDLSDQAYRLSMDGETTGLIDLFTSWNGSIETKGDIEPGVQRQPAFHKAVSIWPNNKQVKKISWNNAGRVDDFSLLDEGETTSLDEIDQHMLAGSVDILTASLGIMQSATKKDSCNIKTKVFDGKRSFTLQGNTIGWETLKQSKYNRFNGPALKCEMSFIPGEGNWHDKLKGWMSIQEQGEQAGAKPTVWLAPLRPGGPAVPVKMMAKTSYGAFIMHLTGYESN